ncbi:MAG: hypothetical protein WAQ56_10430 [Candidatus Nitrotoga sp.]
MSDFDANDIGAPPDHAIQLALVGCRGCIRGRKRVCSWAMGQAISSASTRPVLARLPMAQACRIH